MNNFNTDNTLDDEELSINFKKFIYLLWSRKWLILKVGISIFLFFVLTTFTTTKIYTTNADLYINKTNNSNLIEFNPYVIDEIGGISVNSISDKIMQNELEIIQSPLVIDKVITDNDIKFGKTFGIIPTKKTGTYITAEKFLKTKKLKIENKKGTSVISISYTDKDRELAYGVLSSVITHYIELHKELNSEKSKADKKILEAEYKRAKSSLNARMNSIKGLPTNAINGTGNLAVMGTFSRSAGKAVSNLQRQFAQGEKSQIALKEEAEKVTQLSSKLQWAKLVDEISDTSKVLVLKEPRMLKDYEQTSPKLFINILMGIIFGALGALFAVIIAEIADKRLCYSMIGDNIIYDIENELLEFKSIIYKNRSSKLGFIFFECISNEIVNELKEFHDITMIKADISQEFVNSVSQIDKFILFEKVNNTNAKNYKIIKNIIVDSNKVILSEVLL